MNKRRVLGAMIIAIVFYLVIYCSLSKYGSYEPIDCDISHYGSARSHLLGGSIVVGAKYQWGPYGFVNNKYMWNKPLVVLFTPIWEIDKLYWHSPDLIHYGQYPIDHLMEHRDGEP